MHGQGRMEYSNWDIYDGAWVNGLKHGNGIYTLPYGRKYTGQWVNNQMCRGGIMTTQVVPTFNGSRIDWKPDMSHGQNPII
jgi:hypothetical protein